MECVNCHCGKTTEGTTTVTLVRGDTTLVIKKVPALVCPNCGEDYVDEKVTQELLATAEEAVKTGVEVEVRSYVAACNRCSL